MKGLVFSSFMSTLKNGSPIKNFSASRGLRQGDPLSMFLFIIAEGLSGMLGKARSLGEYQGFRLDRNIQFDLLQFADDTIIVGDGS